MPSLYLRMLLLIVGVIIGVGHSKMAMKLVFVFGNREPIASWVFVLSGPLSTLPASILAFFLPKTAGVWLISGSSVSFAAVVVAWGISENIDPLFVFFIWYSAPMLLLGIFSLLMGRAGDKETGRGGTNSVWYLSGGAICLFTVVAALWARRGMLSPMVILVVNAGALFVGISSLLVQKMVDRRAAHRG